jgi:hypothetical protein
MRLLAVFGRFVVLGFAAGTTACDADTRGANTDGGADTDTDTDTDGDTDGDTDLFDDGGVFEMDCSDCPAVGGTLNNLLCAIDLCAPDVVAENEYTSLVPLEGCTYEDTYEAVERFGSASNDLAPQKNGSYALMASGLAEGTAHSGYCTVQTGGLEDPWSDEPFLTYDQFEWRLSLIAPEAAGGFRFKYMFLSEEYDDYISGPPNDKFYVLLEASSTGGDAKVINFTTCRDPEAYWDFVCGPGDPGCEEGEKYCYIAINSAFSECCWYPYGSEYAPNPGDPPCPDGTWTTDLGGTGFVCATSAVDDGDDHGSSTGWLQTSWPILGGETFLLTFHIHDTADGILDSEVILDAFEFVDHVDQGTIPIE